MPIDPTIALQTKGIQLDSPIQQYGNALAIIHAQNQNRLNDLQYRSGLRAEQDDATLRNTLADPSIGGDLTKASNALLSKGLYKPAIDLQSKALERRKTEAGISKDEAETAAKHLNIISSAFAPLAGKPDVTPEDIASTFARIRAAGVPEDRIKAFEAQVPPNALTLPNFVRGVATHTKEGLAAVQAYLAKPEFKETAGPDGRPVLQPFNTNPMAAGGIGPIAGAPQAAVPVKLDTRDRGGFLESVDPYTGAPQGNRMSKTMTPGDSARLAEEQLHHRRTEAQRAAGLEQGRIPQGYRMNADGSLQAIPGGPADLGKALPNPAVQHLGAAGNAVEDTRRLNSSFKNEYGGHTLLGDMSNTFGRVFGDSTGQSQWWQDMDALQNRTRHDLFGSALTKTELAAWEKTSITPRMDADQIKQNLQRRQEIEARAASKLSRSYEVAGYNKQQIRELLGTGAQYLDEAAPPTSPVSDRRAAPRKSGQRVVVDY